MRARAGCDVVVHILDTTVAITRLDGLVLHLVNIRTIGFLANIHVRECAISGHLNRCLPVRVVVGIYSGGVLHATPSKRNRITKNEDIFPIVRFCVYIEVDGGNALGLEVRTKTRNGLRCRQSNRRGSRGVIIFNSKGSRIRVGVWAEVRCFIYVNPKTVDIHACARVEEG